MVFVDHRAAYSIDQPCSTNDFSKGVGEDGSAAWQKSLDDSTATPAASEFVGNVSLCLSVRRTQMAIESSGWPAD